MTISRLCFLQLEMFKSTAVQDLQTAVQDLQTAVQDLQTAVQDLQTHFVFNTFIPRKSCRILKIMWQKIW